MLVDRIQALIDETGQTGFHFVDEAAPPAGLRALAERLIARGVTITWWGNIRFEKTFTPALAELLARSGCVAVSGGLEVASDRLLALMKKGVTVEQVARVSRAFTDAGIMVHAYLMYGFPSQTEQETIDSLERVRQLFAAGCIQSAYWHRFAATAHSPIGREPAALPDPPAPAAARRTAVRPQRAAVRRSRAPAITSSSGTGCARRSTITCTGSAWTPTCATGSATRRQHRPAPHPPTAGAARSDPARALTVAEQIAVASGQPRAAYQCRGARYAAKRRSTPAPLVREYGRVRRASPARYGCESLRGENP